MKTFKLLFLSFIILYACDNQNNTAKKEQLTNAELLVKATRIHDEVLTLDSHIDINVKNFTDSVNYTQKLDNQVNLPKMEEGGLDVAWFIVYTGQESLDIEGYDEAYKKAIAGFNAIHKLTKEIAPEKIELALTSNDAKRINKSGKKVAMIGVENGYQIGLDINRVKEFYNLGARYMSLSHNGHSQLCDSNTGERDSIWLHNGLSDLGKKVIVEMNKLGMMVDVSHPSKEAMRDMIEISKAPIIASHSSARALCNHSRNLDDEQLEWMKKNGGVVQAVAFSAYVDVEKNKKFTDASKVILEEIALVQNFKILPWNDVRKLEKDAQEKYYDTYMEIRKLAKPRMQEVSKNVDPVNVAVFVNHIDYLVKKLGINHVGISSDFDGGGGVEGWRDASETLNVTIELVKRGYTEKEIEKLWSGNLLRVLDEVQEIAKEIKAS